MAIVLSMQRSTLLRSSIAMSCKACGNTDCLVSDYAAGDMICVKCGCVAARSVQDEGPDWRTYSNKSHEVEKAKHVVTFGELGSATEITCGRPNMYCPPGWRPKTTKLEKRLTRSLQNIKTICSRLFFPEDCGGHSKLDSTVGCANTVSRSKSKEATARIFNRDNCHRKSKTRVRQKSEGDRRGYCYEFEICGQVLFPHR